MRNREWLNVLSHPLTESPSNDRCAHAMWLGTPVAIRLDVLRPSYRNELLADQSH
jgi:aromatic ring-cleaving dioxygenase